VTVTLNRDQSRLIDRLAIDEFGMTGLVLMENAGRGCVDKLIELGVDGPVIICCGKGNNAGDGFVMARHLQIRGYQVEVMLAAGPQHLRGDALADFQILEKYKVFMREMSSDEDQSGFIKFFKEADWIVDALLGTGASGEPRPPIGRLIQLVNAQDARRMAIDIPSGLDCDSGKAANNTFRADHTCTLVAAKPGLLLPESRPYVGQLHVVDIGVPRELIDRVVKETL